MEDKHSQMNSNSLKTSWTCAPQTTSFNLNLLANIQKWKRLVIGEFGILHYFHFDLLFSSLADDKALKYHLLLFYIPTCKAISKNEYHFSTIILPPYFVDFPKFQVLAYRE